MTYLYSGDLNLSQFIENQIKLKIANSKKLQGDGQGGVQPLQFGIADRNLISLPGNPVGYNHLQQNFNDFSIQNSASGASSHAANHANLVHVNMAVDLLIEFLRVSDEYLLEELKNNC